MKDLTVIRKLLENPLKLGREFSRKTIKPKTILDLLAYYPNMVYHLSDSKYGKLLFNNPKAVAKQAEKELIEKIIQKYVNNSRLRYFKNKENLGRVENYKKALYTYATGEYVLFLVMFLPYIVIYLKTLFEAHKELTGGKDEI